MSKEELSAVTRWRKQRRQQGFVRVEVQVRECDAGLVRDVAKALRDPERERETRTLLCENLDTRSNADLKAMLFSAPLEGINLERPRDFGREIDL